MDTHHRVYFVLRFFHDPRIRNTSHCGHARPKVSVRKIQLYRDHLHTNAWIVPTVYKIIRYMITDSNEGRHRSNTSSIRCPCENCQIRIMPLISLLLLHRARACTEQGGSLVNDIFGTIHARFIETLLPTPLFLRRLSEPL